MKVKYKFSYGDKLKDVVTGFTGTCTGLSSYITGCNQYLIVAKSKDSSSKATSIWYDEDRLKLIEQSAIQINVGKDPGSDIEAPNKG